MSHRELLRKIVKDVGMCDKSWKNYCQRNVKSKVVESEGLAEKHKERMESLQRKSSNIQAHTLQK